MNLGLTSLRIHVMRIMIIALSMLVLGFAAGTATTLNGFEGRWKLAGDGTCYLDQTDGGPDQCSAIPGRWKLGGDGSCQWDDDDSGPNQCNP